MLRKIGPFTVASLIAVAVWLCILAVVVLANWGLFTWMHNAAHAGG